MTLKKRNNEKTNGSFLQRMGNKKGLLAIGIIVVLMLIILVTHFFQSSEAEGETEQTYAVHIVREEDPILFDGKVQAAEVQEEYYDPAKGVIAEILVENGQEVEEGTALFTYQNEETQQLLDEQNHQYSRLEERYAEAETELANAKKALDTANANIEESNRQNQAASENSEAEMLVEPQDNLLEAEANKAEAEATIDSVEMTLNELTDQMEDITYEIEKLRQGVTTTVQADFKGVVELNETNPASLQSSEQPVVRLMSHDLKIESTVSEYDYNKLSVNSPVDIYLMNSNRELKGTITKIAALPLQAVEAEGATSSRYPFTVLPDESIQYGFSVQIGYSEGIMYLPQNAVVEEEDGTTIVYVNKDGIVEKRSVTVSEESNFYVIESGLTVDEEVLLDPDPSLADGDEVMVMYD